MSSNRVHFTRRKSYNTKSNKIRKIRTPGGRLAAQYVKKREKAVQPMFETKSKLSGLKQIGHHARSRLTRTQRQISRPYGGVLTPKQLKERILKAFLCSEVQISKQMAYERVNEKK
jgi:large subunit ribosomal protein L34e